MFFFDSLSLSRKRLLKFKKLYFRDQSAFKNHKSKSWRGYENINLTSSNTYVKNYTFGLKAN